MATVAIQIEDWATLPWKKYQRNVYRLQQRIYRATRRGDWKRVHSLQRLLLRSWSARCLAVRRVTQENQGKRTPGIDGVASLTPGERLALAKRLRHWSSWEVAPIRRTYIPKPGTDEKRGLGIPVMSDRACQALVKQALEPEWEAQFEPNSYGFRPGRSPHDAIEAIFKYIRFKPKSVFDADFEKCFDRIDRNALLKKLNTIQPIERLVRDWLRAGIWDKGQWVFPEAGTPQGGTISPLLANIALHGLETIVKAVCPKKPPAVIRFADDIVILHEDLTILNKAIEVAGAWAAEMGLNFKASKTRITHTLDEYEGNVGFDFLGFHIRQYRVGQYHTSTYRGKPGFKTIIKPSRKATRQHQDKIGQVIRQYRGAPQAALIAALNPIIRGWALYHRTCVAKHTFSTMDMLTYHKLARWASYRHPRKTRGWQYRRYWRSRDGRIDFSDKTTSLARHKDTPIIRHVKVRGDKSPYDGDWAYWSARLGRDPTKPQNVTRLLKQQKGCCTHCGLRFMADDVMEIHHKDGNRSNNRRTNLALLHVYCHDQVHGEKRQ
jgi:RNA-directed DNA polymerase